MSNPTLMELSDQWMTQARIRFRDAALEQDPMGKRLIEHGATCYFNCARELQRAIQTGDVPPNFGLEILKKDTESPGG